MKTYQRIPRKVIQVSLFPCFKQTNKKKLINSRHSLKGVNIFLQRLSCNTIAETERKSTIIDNEDQRAMSDLIERIFGIQYIEITHLQARMDLLSGKSGSQS